MATRRGLGRGLGAIIPENNVSRGTSADKKSAPAAKKATPAKRPTKAKSPAKKQVAGTPAGKPAIKQSGSGSNQAPQPIAGLIFADLPIASIKPNAQQPRTVFDEEALAELVHSIKEVGLLQPIVVRKADQGYELIAGERRLRASKKAGLKSIPALIRETADDDMLRDALLENLHRADLTPLEEAAAYQQLLEDFGCTQDELAKRLGRSRPQITNTLRLLNLPPSVQRRVAAGILSAGHARALLGLKDAEAIERLAKRIVAEGLSVRTVEELVSIGDLSTPTKKSTKKSGSISAPGLAELGERMSDRLDTRVKVLLGQKKGTVQIEFATLEDLRRIVEIIDPPRVGMFGEPLK